MATKLVDRAVATLQTANATPTTIVTYTLPDETIAQFIAQVVGQQSGSTNTAGYFRRYCYKRQSAGSATIVGTVDSAVLPDKEDNAAWDVTVTTSGNNVLLQVTGAAVTIDWFAVVDVVLYTP